MNSVFLFRHVGLVLAGVMGLAIVSTLKAQSDDRSCREEAEAAENELYSRAMAALDAKERQTTDPELRKQITLEKHAEATRHDKARVDIEIHCTSFELPPGLCAQEKLNENKRYFARMREIKKKEYDAVNEDFQDEVARLPNREQKKAQRHRLITSEYDAENASHSRVWLNLERGFCSGIALTGKAEETEQTPAESPVPAAPKLRGRNTTTQPQKPLSGRATQPAPGKVQAPVLDRSGDDSAVIDWSAWYDGLVGIIGPQFFSRLGGFHAGLSCNVQYTVDSHGSLTYTITKPSGNSRFDGVVDEVMRSLDHQPILAFPVAESRRGSRVQSRRYAVSNTVVFKVPVGQTKDAVTHTKRYEMEYLDYRDGYWASRVTVR